MDDPQSFYLVRDLEEDTSRPWVWPWELEECPDGDWRKRLRSETCLASLWDDGRKKKDPPRSVRAEVEVGNVARGREEEEAAIHSDAAVGKVWTLLPMKSKFLLLLLLLYRWPVRSLLPSQLWLESSDLPGVPSLPRLTDWNWSWERSKLRKSQDSLWRKRILILRLKSWEGTTSSMTNI